MLRSSRGHEDPSTVGSPGSPRVTLTPPGLDSLHSELCLAISPWGGTHIMRLVFNTSCGLSARASTEHARGAPEALVQPTSRAGGTPPALYSKYTRCGEG